MPRQLSRYKDWATGRTTRNRSSIPDRGKIFSFKNIHIGSVPHTAFHSADTRVKELRPEVYHSLPSNNEVQNGWSFNSTPSFALVVFTETTLALLYKGFAQKIATKSAVVSSKIILQSLFFLHQCNQVQYFGVIKNYKNALIMFQNVKAAVSVLCRISLKCLTDVISI